jgi:hypothetical protein
MWGEHMTFRGMLKTAAAGAGILALPSMAMAEEITDQNTSITGVTSTAQVTVELVAEVTGTLILEVNDEVRGTTTLVGDGGLNGFGGDDDYGTVSFGQVSSGGLNASGQGSVYAAPAASSAYVAELQVQLTYTGLASAIVTIEGAQPTGTAGANAGAPAAEWACDGGANSSTWTSGTGTTLGAAATCATWTSDAESEDIYAVDLAFIVAPTTAPDTWQTDYVFTAVPTIVP